MLSKVRPCHSVNVLTFPGCDRECRRGNGNGTDLHVREHASLGGNVVGRLWPANLAPSPVLDACEECNAELREEAHVRAVRPTVVPQRPSVVLHNAPTAAGDDASHRHARDEAPTTWNRTQGSCWHR